MNELLMYEAPSVEVIELGHEGQIMQMSGIPNYNNGGDPLNAMLLP